MSIDSRPAVSIPWLMLLGPACIALLLAASAPAQAQVPLDRRHFQVELVVFEQPAGSAELRPLDRRTEKQPGTGAEGEAGMPLEVELDEELRAAVGEVLPAGYQGPVLPGQLNAVATRLNRGGYRLLWHQAWVQRPAEVAGTDLGTLAILGGGPADAGLSGAVSLSAGRFLHLGLELELRSEAGLEALLSQRRRIRPDVEQYFDHPHIGVIAVLRLVDPELLSPGQDGQADQATGPP